MLLKCTSDGKNIKVNSSPVNGGASRGTAMKMTMSTTPTMTARVHRKVMRVAAPHKRYPGGKASAAFYAARHHAAAAARLYAPTRIDATCDNSNDSGLGSEQNMDPRHLTALRFSEHAESSGSDSRENEEIRRKRMEMKFESDDPNDNFSFPELCPKETQSTEKLSPKILNVRAGGSIYSPGKLSRGGGKLYSNPYVEFGGEKHNKMSSGGKLSAGKLSAGKLSSGKLSPGKLSAGKLSSGKLSAGKLSSGKLSAGKLSSGKLSAGKLAGGKLTTGKFAGSSGKIANGSGKLANALARRRMMPANKQIGPLTLSSQLCSTSRDGRVQLQILCQPETQHRARYQTEGSRGAVKDNSGNGFPVVKLIGYDKPAVLQVFIGTDTGRVAPHMFYQACRVSGKNSTPCSERKEDGTVVIEIDLDPVKSWQVTCDCVGILKERNVDVEHRFGLGEQMSGSKGVGGAGASAAAMARGKKKSTRCRMVFRTQILTPDGTHDTLQICSSQIICTQPPGVPEICRKSLVSCPATGGLELYLLGKNFLKDSRVVFMLSQDNRAVWEEHAIPDKEFLQQTHLVCCVPPFQRVDIVQPVAVQMYVWAGGKPSESHRFLYTPPALDTGPRHATLHHPPGIMSGCESIGEEARSVVVWGSSAHMMPPPAPPTRRPSLLPEHAPLVLKTEDMDENSQPSIIDNELSQMSHSDNSNMSLMVNDNSMDENSRHGRIMIDRDDSNLSIMDDNSVASFANARLLQNQLRPPLIQHFGTVSNPASQIMPVVMSDNLKAVDLQLKSDTISNSSLADSHSLVPFSHFIHPQVKLHSSHSNGPFATNLSTKREIELENQSPLVSFTQQLQAIQTQVQTDKMMETVAAAIFKVESAAATSQQYATRPMLGPMTSMGEIERMMATKTVDETISTNMKQIEASIMHENSLGNDTMSNTIDDSRADSQMMDYSSYVRVEKLQTAEQCEQSAQMEALVNDAMEASILSTDTVASAKLDALVNSTVDNHMLSGIRDVPSATTSPSHATDILLSPSSVTVLPSATLSPHTSDTISPDVMPSRHAQLSPGMMISNSSAAAEELMMMQSNEQIHATVTTPPAAVKTMILNAAAEILTSDTAMNALVTSAINTANILSGETASANANGLVCTQAPSAPTAELQELQAETDRQRIADGLQPVYLPTEGVAEAMSQAVTQAVSQVVSQAVSQAVSQTPAAPMQDLTSMSDSDLLSYINPSCFDQV